MQGWKIFFKGERLALAGASGLPKFERRCRLAVLFTAGHLQLHETQGIGREALRPCWRTRRAFLPKKRRCPTRIQEGLAWPGGSPCLVCAQGAKEAVEGQKSYRRHHPYGLRNCCPP